MKKFAFAAMLALGVVALMAPPAAFAQDEKPFTIHGEVRTRLEYNNNTQDFADSDTGPGFDDGAGYFPYRIRIAAEGRFTRNVTAWIEFQNTGLFGEQGLITGTDARRINDPFRSTTSMYQGYIDIGELWSKSFSLRIGRQEMVYGNEFIFGDEDFYSGISHDGIVGTFDHDKWDLHVFYTRIDENSVFQFSDQDVPPDVVVPVADASNIEQFGGYFTWDITKNSDFDGYIVNVNDRGEGGRWQTIGARWGRDGWDHNGLVWNIEYAIQTGTVVTEGFGAIPAVADVDAGGQAGEGLIGWNFKGDKNVHRVFGRFEMATGDDATSADEDEGWIPLAGEIHNRTGRGDWFRIDDDTTELGAGVSGGLFAWAVGYTGLFNQKHEIGAQYWDYSLEEDNDSPLGDGLGQAFDVWYALNFTKNVALEASYSNLSPDDALTGGGGAPDDSVERFYGQIRLRF